MKIIDLSLVIDNECMTCGTPWHEKVRIERLGELEKVGRNTSKFVLGSHSATHMDAPLHFIPGGHGTETIDLNTCVGPVTCVDFRHIGAGMQVTAEDIKNIKLSERMLFVFGWYKNWKTDKFYKNFPFFSLEATQIMIDAGVKLIALDTPSPDDGSGITALDDSPNHKLLLAKDVVIVEYLCNTDAIDFDKNYEIIALPLKILGADGTPSRVILREV